MIDVISVKTIRTTKKREHELNGRLKLFVVRSLYCYVLKYGLGAF
jgi:hypothetical protein